MGAIKILDGATQRTTDLSIFKKLRGNRDVKEERIAKIENSMRESGWITPTIIVNEKMEVIDGQGRLEVAKRNNLPIEYKVISGIGIDECRRMNIDQTNWAILDYCKSYADQGSEDYRRFVDICNAFADFPFSIVSCAVTGNSSTSNANLKHGKLICTKEQEQLAKEVLVWLREFNDGLSDAPIGVRTKLYAGLIFAYTSVDEADKDRILSTISAYSFSPTETLASIHEALKFIERQYNNRLSAKNKVYFEHEYMLVQAKKNPWYEAKWGWHVYED